MDRNEARGADRVVLTLALVVSAYLLSVAVVYHGHPWLGWLALFPLFVSIRVQRPLGAMFSGGLWGLSLFFFLFAAGHSSAASPASFALLTGVPAAFALLTSMLTGRAGFNPLIVGVGWALVELALAPLGFRAGLFGATQADGVLLSVVGNSLGYVIVGFLAAFVGALLVTVLEKVRVPVGAPRPSTCAANAPTHLYPQTLECPSLLDVQPCRPRAPPRSLAFGI